MAGPVSKYIGGLYRENPALTWTELKSSLIRQYASELTAIEAVRKRSRLQQEESEDMGDLGERIAGLAALAFPEPETRNSGLIQALLADTYMDALSDRKLRGDVLREEPSTLAEAIEADRNSKRLWDRIRGSVGRDLRGTNIVKERDQFRARDPKEVEGWESEADPNGRKWDPRYRFYRPSPDWYGIVCGTCNHGGHRSRDCPTNLGRDSMSQEPNCTIDGEYGHNARWRTVAGDRKIGIEQIDAPLPPTRKTKSPGNAAGSPTKK